jgi:hypothetical protein
VGATPNEEVDVISLWILLGAAIVAGIAFLVVPRLRKQPPRGSGPGPKRGGTDGPPTLGTDPKGPPAP